MIKRWSRTLGSDRLNRDERSRLAERMIAGDAQARNLLFAAHLPLVKAIAKRYHSTSMTLDDLFQVGCIGLLEAVRAFDGRGAFRGYASEKIRWAICRETRRDRLVGPRLWGASWSKPGTQPVIAAYSDDDDRFSPDVVVSLVDELVDLEQFRDTVIRALEGAPTPQVAQVIRMHFGFDGPPRTLQEIGAALGITLQRVEQIGRKGLRFLVRRLGLADFASAATAEERAELKRRVAAWKKARKEYNKPSLADLRVEAAVPSLREKRDALRHLPELREVLAAATARHRAGNA